VLYAFYNVAGDVRSSLEAHMHAGYAHRYVWDRLINCSVEGQEQEAASEPRATIVLPVKVLCEDIVRIEPPPE
jgi:hypothetical protein